MNGILTLTHSSLKVLDVPDEWWLLLLVTMALIRSLPALAWKSELDFLMPLQYFSLDFYSDSCCLIAAVEYFEVGLVIQS